MNVYDKIIELRVRVLNANLKKSGKNKYSNFDYFELKDFLPFVTNNAKELKLYSKFSITPATPTSEEMVTMLLLNTEKIDEVDIYTLPTAECFIGLKKDGTGGADPIQNLGGKITYLRRYMWLIVLDLIEDDSVDAKEQITRQPYTPKPIDSLPTSSGYKQENHAIDDSTRIGLEKILASLDKPENATYKRTVLSTICKEQNVDGFMDIKFTKDFTYKALILRVTDLIAELKKLEVK